MSAIEPNGLSLLWFTLLWTLCCVGSLGLSGSFPLNVARERGKNINVLLALSNTALMAVLVVLTLAFGFLELRVTTLVVVAGLVFLFAPAPFEVWPEKWRDGRAVLSALLIVQGAGLVAVCELTEGRILPPLT